MKTKKIAAILLSLILFCNTMLICTITTFAAKKIIYVNVDKDKIDYDLPIMVSLGDSYSSGEGNEHFYDYDKPFSDRVNSSAWLAHRSENSWPGKLVLTAKDGSKIKMSDYRGKNWIFAASSGAVTWNLYDGHEQEKTASQIKSLTGNAFSDFDIKTQYLAPQLEVFKSLKKDSTDYITMTMGGNDAGFTDVIISALVLRNRYFDPNCFSAFLQSKTNNFNKADGIRSNLETAYGRIAEAAGSQAHIIIAGYPNLLEPTGKTIVFSSFEANEIKRAVNYFNSGIHDLVKSLSEGGMKIHFVSVMDENKDYNFCGHEAYSSEPYINEIKLIQNEDINALSPVSAYSIHPNEEGLKVYAHCVQEEINLIEKEKGNNSEPLVVEIDDDHSSNFKSGKYLVNIENKIIAANSNGIYYKENVASNAEKISNTGNVISLLSDGRTVYYAACQNSFGEPSDPRDIYVADVDKAQSKKLFSTNGSVDFITCMDHTLYYTESIDYGANKLMKYDLETNVATEIVYERSDNKSVGWIDSAYCMGKVIYFTENNSLCSYSITEDEYKKIISASDGRICDTIGDKVYYFYSKNGKSYVSIISSDDTVETSVPIPSSFDLQIINNKGEYALFFNKEQSDTDTMFDLYKMDLRSGELSTSKNEAGRYKNKNYFVTRDLSKPENIYFMYNLGIYDESSNKIINKKHDEYEIDITKPMWVIDGYIVDWDLNTYKIYDEVFDNSTSVSNKTITKEEAETLALNDMGEGEYQAVYWKNVQYNGKEYFLINLRWKVDDGNGKFHYSHIGYKIVSMDGNEILNADYINDQVQVY